MYQIATLNKISKVGLDCFSEGYMISEDVNSADGIIVRSQDMTTMEFSDKLKAIARAGAGVNNIPIDRCAKEGIVVFNSPGANANAVKELVLCGMLLATRNIPQAIAWAKTLEEDVSKQVEKGKSNFAGTEIYGKTLGIIGLGAIGRKVAHAAGALGMKILAYDPIVTSGGEGISIYTNLQEMLPLCDFVTLHLPANKSTKGMVNKEFFQSMKDGSILLNFSRDKLIAEMDLAVALESGKVSKYVTDFPNDNLVGRENMILIPHLGASTEEAENNCAMMAVKEVRDYFENGNIINSVNFPKVDMGPLEEGVRLSFIVKDMEEPLDEVIRNLSGSGIIIRKTMWGKREDGIAYVLVETDEKEAPKLLFKGDFGTKIIRYRPIEK